jgi:hypothetical protein
MKTLVKDYYHEFWPQAEVAVADALKQETWPDALREIDTAFHLILSNPFLSGGGHQRPEA